MNHQKRTLLMPAIFIGHGSPMMMIEENPYYLKWQEYFALMPEVKYLISISAHWVTKGLKITTNNPQRLIYDFYGFLQALYDIHFPVSGSLELASLLKKTLNYEYTPILTNEWGLDHGTWSVIYRINPRINIPVIQLSIDSTLSFREHYQLGRQLKNLKDESVLLLGSGNIVHNLRYCRSYKNKEEIYLWARLFQRNILSFIQDKNITGLLEYMESGSKEIELSIASKEHFIPLLYILAQLEDDEVFDCFNIDFPVTALDMSCVAIRKI